MQYIKYFLLLFICYTVNVTSYSQGQFAGAKPKTLIGKMYNNDLELPGLPGYEYRESSLAADEGDAEQFSVTVFQKGTTYLAFFALNEDTTTDKYKILDVLIIKKVRNNQVVKTLLCRDNKKSNLEIVAVTQPKPGEEFSKALKAWRFNRDKRRFELFTTQNIDCLNEGDD